MTKGLIAIFITGYFFLSAVLLPAKVEAGITLVTGGAVNGSSLNGGNVTLNLPAGIQTGDVVIFYGGHPHRAGTNLGPSTAGYAPIATYSSAAPNFGAWYKIMGATPDTQVVGYGTGNGADATAYAAFVLRDVNIDTVLDQTVTTAGPTTSTNPNPPAITTQTDGAWVLALAGSQINDTSPGTPANYSNLNTKNGNDSNDITVAGVTREIASITTENPPAFPSWSSAAWYAITVALRPVALPTVTTQAVTNIKDVSATASGTVTATGGENADKQGFVYDTVSKGAPGNLDPGSSGYANFSENSGSYGTGAFTVNLTGLTGGVTYYGRAYAHNSTGYSYGDEVSFSTIAVSISITSDGTISYGVLAPSASKDTTTSGLNDSQTAQNNSTMTEDFNIKTSNATGGTPWTLGLNPGSDVFVHEFSTNGGSNWTKFTDPDTYQSLVSGITSNTTQTFDLRLTAPTSSSDYQQKTVTVTIQAVSH